MPSAEEKKHAKTTPAAFWWEPETGFEGNKQTKKLKHQTELLEENAGDQGLGVRQREDGDKGLGLRQQRSRPGDGQGVGITTNDAVLRT